MATSQNKTTWIAESKKTS